MHLEDGRSSLRRGAWIETVCWFIQLLLPNWVAPLFGGGRGLKPELLCRLGSMPRSSLLSSEGGVD